jgi:tetratricopeptide (TPR) repeat protein
MKPYKTLNLIIFIIICQFNIFGQRTRIDSLIKIIKNSKSDTVKVLNLNDICLQFIDQASLDTALNYGSQALILSQQLNYTRGLAKAHSNMGFVYLCKANYTLSLSHYLKTLDILTDINDKKGMAGTLGNLGILFYYQQKYSESLNYNFKALKLNEELKNVTGIIASLKAIAELYETQKNFKSALDFYNKALKIAKSNTSDQNVSDILSCIGNVFVNEEKYDKALTYFQSALSVCEKIGDKEGLGWSYFMIGNIYVWQSKLDEAIFYYNQSLNLAHSNNFYILEAQSYNLIGYVYELKGEIHKAIEYVTKGLHVNEKTNWDSGTIPNTIHNLINLSRLYSDIGKINESIKLTEQGISILLKYPTQIDLRLELENNLSLYHKALAEAMNIKGDYSLAINNYRLSLDHNAKAFILKDSILAKDRRNHFREVEMQRSFEEMTYTLKTEHEKKEIINKNEIAKQKLVRNSFVTGFAFVLLLSLIIYRNYRQKQKSNKELTEKNHEIAEKNKEILDSIRYAKRIQTSLLPTEKYIERILNKHDKSTGA